MASWKLVSVGWVLQVNGQIPRGFVVLKPGHEETEENLTNFLESRLQVKTDSHRAQAIDDPQGCVVLKPGHEETEENLTNFLESRLQVKTDSLRAQAIDKPITRVSATGEPKRTLSPASNSQIHDWGI
jgi:hypothetical protein